MENKMGNKQPNYMERWRFFQKWVESMDHLVLDSCALMEERGADAFYARLLHIAKIFQDRKNYASADQRLIWIPESCIVEMFSKAEGSPGDTAVLRRARRALERVEKLRELDVLTVIEDQALRNYGDSALCSIAIAANSALQLGFITQDKKLTKDLLQLKKLESLRCRLSVRCIDADGYLALTASDVERRGKEIIPCSKPRGCGSIHAYSCAGEPPAQPNRALDAAGDVEEGDVLYRADGSAVMLSEEINSGNEAVILSVEGEKDLCAKVLYAPTLFKQRKVELLASRAFEIAPKEGGGVIFPEEPLFNAQGVFKGYLMKRLPQTVSLRNMPALLVRNDRRFDGWDRRQFAIFSLCLANLIYSAHVKGILLSDISDQNILVGVDPSGVLNPYEVYIIDTDSAQLGPKEGPVYPSDGVSPCFTSREEFENGWDCTKLRSYKSELFSAALVSAQALMCGLHPFRSSAQGETEYIERGEEIEENIKSGVFPYGSREERRTAGSASPGLGAYIWSNLPVRTKRFLRKALTGPAQERPSMKEIIQELQFALEAFHDDAEAQKYSQLRSIYPTQYKEYWAKCEMCGETFDAANTGVSRNDHFLCDACAEKPVAHCSKPGCGNVTLRAGERLLGRYAHKFCDACWEKEQQALSHYAGCSCCGRSFPVTVAEARNPPQKCPVCRQEESAQAVSSPGQSAEAQTGKRGLLDTFFHGLRDDLRSL